MDEHQGNKSLASRRVVQSNRVEKDCAMKAQKKKANFVSRTSWHEKLEKQQEAKIVNVPLRMQLQWGTGKMLIPRPLDVDALIRTVPRGKLVTVNQIRERLAREHGADVTCPLTTGIFIRIASEAAEEDRRAGKSRITPYWRVLREGGRLNEKFPGGVAAQADKLRAEAHVIQAKSKAAARVRNFQHKLVKWEIRAKILLVFAVALFSMCSLGRADFRYTQSGWLSGAGVQAVRALSLRYGQGPVKYVTGTIYVKGGWLRIDGPDGTYGIIDVDGRRELQVDPAKRIYSVITFDAAARARNPAAFQRGAEAGVESPPQSPEASDGFRIITQAKTVFTGKTGFLLGQKARELKIETLERRANGAQLPGSTGPASDASYAWVAPSVPGFREVRALCRRLAAAAGQEHADLAGNSGVLLLTALTIAGGAPPGGPGGGLRPDPNWVILMTKGFIDLFEAAQTPDTLPLYQSYSMTDLVPPNSASSGRSTSAARTARVEILGLHARVTAYSTDILDRSLFQAPASYVETPWDIKNAWIDFFVRM
jgi:6-O-methylguanine DNA methyltransferase, DNA binding domain